MIVIKSDREIEGMKEAGRMVAKTHLAIQRVLRPGLTTLQINDFAEKFMAYKDCLPAQLGYEGFPYALCTSVNDEVCHGFPSERILEDGDILSIDNVIQYKGFLADSCWSYGIGKVSDEDQELLEVTEKALYLGVEAAQVNNRLIEIGKAIQPFVEANGFSVVRQFVGHGIGKKMHEDPQILHYVSKFKGPRLRENMVITVEPMVNVGTWETKLDANGWVARTKDGKKSCQFEHTFAIRKDGPEILTRQEETNLTSEEQEWIDSYPL